MRSRARPAVGLQGSPRRGGLAVGFNGVVVKNAGSQLLNSSVMTAPRGSESSETCITTPTMPWSLTFWMIAGSVPPPPSAKTVTYSQLASAST
jgi:hypothetical protein